MYSRATFVENLRSKSTTYLKLHKHKVQICSYANVWFLPVTATYKFFITVLANFFKCTTNKICWKTDTILKGPTNHLLYWWNALAGVLETFKN